MNWGKWFYSLVAAVVGGACNTAAAMLVAPETFNFQDLAKLGKLLLAGAVISLVLFLKQSPLPPLDKSAQTSANNLLVLFFAGLLMLAGCATPGQTPAAAEVARARQIGTMAQLASYTGTQVWISKHPTDRAYFEASLVALDALLVNGKATPAAFAAALQGLPIKELQGDQATLIIGSVVILYDAYMLENVNLDANVYLRPIIEGVRDGIDKGLHTFNSL